MEKQLSFLDYEETNPELVYRKTMQEIEANKENIRKAVKTWLDSSYSILYGNPEQAYLSSTLRVLWNNFSTSFLWNRDSTLESAKRELIDYAKTECLHYFSTKLDNTDSISSFGENGEYHLMFNIGDQILFHSGVYKDGFKEPIRFPTSCIHMFDKNGYEIHFGARDQFIMDRLNLKELGKQHDIFKNYRREFCTVNVYLHEITQWLTKTQK